MLLLLLTLLRGYVFLLMSEPEPHPTRSGRKVGIEDATIVSEISAPAQQNRVGSSQVKSAFLDKATRYTVFTIAAVPALNRYVSWYDKSLGENSLLTKFQGS